MFACACRGRYRMGNVTTYAWPLLHADSDELYGVTAAIFAGVAKHW